MKSVLVVLLLGLTTVCSYSFTISIENADGTVEIKNYDDSTEELYFYMSKAVRISGLNQFKKLKRLGFEMPAYLTDFSFLSGNDSIEELVIRDAQLKDIGFIYKMPSLKKLVIQGGSFYGVVDLSKISWLEYLEITNAGLTEFPAIVANQSHIKCINIAYNRIPDINISFDNSNLLIFAIGNPLRVKYNYIIMGELIEVLPTEYIHFIR